MNDYEKIIVQSLIGVHRDFVFVHELTTNEPTHDPTHDPDYLTAALDAMRSGGLIEYWDRSDGLAFTFTPYGANHYNVKLLNSDNASAWVMIGEPVVGQKVERFKNDQTDKFALFGDGRPSPLELMIIIEDEDRLIGGRAVDGKTVDGAVGKTVVKTNDGNRAVDKDGVKLPKPREYLSSNQLLPYRGGVCSTCGGRGLGENTYCLECDRWGRDGQFTRPQFIWTVAKNPAARKTDKQVKADAKKRMKAKSKELHIRLKQEKAKMKAETRRKRKGESRGRKSDAFNRLTSVDAEQETEVQAELRHLPCVEERFLAKNAG